MRNIFALTRSEQRVIIFIVVVLVLAAFMQHLLQTRSGPGSVKSISSPTASPTIRSEEEQTNGRSPD